MSSVRELLDELEWPSFEARRDQSSFIVEQCLLKRTSI